MTVSTELSHEEYVGNGVTTDFDFRFRIFESKHLIVVVADNDGNETTLKNGTDYTIVGAGSYHGGKVVLNKPLAKDWKILLERDLPVVQETDLRNQGKFFAEVHEDAFDYLTMLIQKALGTFSLSLRKPTYLSNYYDAKGNRIANLASPKFGSDSANKDYVDNSVKDIDSKTLRVKDKPIPALPSAEQRRNKQLGFDNEGYPQLLDPAETGSLGYVLVDSFEKGAEITTRYQALHWESNGEYHRWDGNLPKSVPAGSNPDSSGGTGVGKWLSIGDASLRREISNGFISISGVRNQFQFSVESVADLSNIPQAVLRNATSITVNSYFKNSKYGGAIFKYIGDFKKDQHDGGYVISPTVPFNNLDDFLNGVGETDIGGVGCFVSEHYGKGEYIAEQFGSIPNLESAKYNNKLSYLYMCSIIDKKGGVIRYGNGDFYLSDSNYKFSGDSVVYKKRGIAGSGVGLTKLILSNAEDIALVSTAKDVFWCQFSDFDAVAEGESRIQNLIDTKAMVDYKGGIPRSTIKNIRAFNFKDPFRLNAWVCDFHNLESNNSLVGFSYIRGTSIKGSSLYALNCKYGHIFGGFLLEDNTDINLVQFEAHGINYSDFSSLAVDRSEMASYIILITDGVVINGCGFEVPQSNGGFIFPEYTTEMPDTHLSPIIINGVSTYTNVRKSTVPFITVLRNGASARFNSFSRHINFGYDVKIKFSEKLQYCDIGLTDSDMGFNPINKLVNGLTINGQHYGDIYVSPFNTKIKSSNGSYTHLNTIYTEVKNHNTINIPIRGDFVKSIDNLLANIKIYLTNNATNFQQSIVKSIDVSAMITSSGEGVSKTSDGETIVVSITDNLFGDGSKGLQIKINDENSANVYSIIIDAHTTALFDPENKNKRKAVFLM